MRKHLRRFVPDAEAMRSHRLVLLFGRWLTHPSLWHLNRRSVPGAVAIGLFCGLIPGPVQMLGALLMAIPLRKNVPVAMVVTIYTNPLTIVPLYVIAYAYGKLLLGHRGPDDPITPFQWDWTLQTFLDWMMSLGKPLGVGLVALALTLAIVGYFATVLLWRWHVIWAWRRRAARRRSGGGRARP